MIGTVISADMDRIAQMQPNNLARFVEVDMDAALKERAAYKSRVARLTELLRNRGRTKGCRTRMQRNRRVPVLRLCSTFRMSRPGAPLWRGARLISRQSV